MEPTTIPTAADVQASAPTVHVSLSRVGVTGVEKVIRIGAPGAEQLYYAKLDCFVDLGPQPEGRAHVALRGGRQRRRSARSSSARPASRPSSSPQHIAEHVRERQDALRAEVTIAARYPEHKPAPVSGIPTQEIYTLLRLRRRVASAARAGSSASPRRA